MSAIQSYTIDGVRDLIRAAAKASSGGTLRSLSVDWAIPYSYLSAALHTQRSPSPKILEKLGLRRLVQTHVAYVREA